MRLRMTFGAVMGLLGAIATLPVTRAAVADDAQTLASCPAVGDAAAAKVQALNTLKRRMTVPMPGDIDPNVTLSDMVAPGDDTTRWDDSGGAAIGRGRGA